MLHVGPHESKTYGDGFDSHYMRYWAPCQYKDRLSRVYDSLLKDKTAGL